MLSAEQNTQTGTFRPDRDLTDQAGLDDNFSENASTVMTQFGQTWAQLSEQYSVSE